MDKRKNFAPPLPAFDTGKDDADHAGPFLCGEQFVRRPEKFIMDAPRFHASQRQS